MKMFRRYCLVSLALGLLGAAGSAGDPYPLSRQLRTLEADLQSPAYQAVLATMIVTDLQAEWLRVATPDNYRRFQEEHNGLARIQSDPQLRAAYERRKRIAEQFLGMLRQAYQARQQKPPFDDPEILSVALLAKQEQRNDAAPAPTPAIRPYLVAAGAEKQWPGFRGPTAQGFVFDTEIPLTWSATESILWRTRLPGKGNSSPVIWGDQIFLTAEGAAGKNGPERLLLAYDRKTGALLWQHAAPEPPEVEKLYRKNSLASSTPASDGERVVAFFGNSGLLCCDLAGNRLWHRNLGLFRTIHGPGSSPVIYKDLVILIQDLTQGKSVCAAFDKRTGEERWRVERRNAACWCTPVIIRVGDRDELVYNGSGELIAYDPETGAVRWRTAGPSGESIPMIVSGGGLIYSASGRNGPVFAVRPGGTGDITQTHIVWKNRLGGPHVPSPVYHDGRIYLVSDTGIVSALDAKSGELLWEERLRGRFSASPLVVGDRILFVNEDGETFVIRSRSEFELLAENPLNEYTVATPAVVGGRLYFRTAEHLICIGK